jgi:ribosome-binding protein aMBF1 (putative translation factor)
MSKSKYNNTNGAGMRIPDCQDWTPVSLSKNRPATVGTALASSSANNSASTSAASASATASAADDTTKKTKYIAKATSDTIRQTRCDKKLTQKELAQKCNMDVSIIAEIERGGNCVYNATHVNKIQSVLGVKIPRA